MHEKPVRTVKKEVVQVEVAVQGGGFYENGQKTRLFTIWISGRGGGSREREKDGAKGVKTGVSKYMLNHSCGN